jgi:hypothetical protein
MFHGLYRPSCSRQGRDSQGKAEDCREAGEAEVRGASGIGIQEIGVRVSETTRYLIGRNVIHQLAGKQIGASYVSGANVTKDT